VGGGDKKIGENPIPTHNYRKPAELLRGGNYPIRKMFKCVWETQTVSCLETGGQVGAGKIISIGRW